MTELSLNILDICQNSIKANSTEIVISINEDIKNDILILDISDNGCGMSEETVSKIFEPYFTTKANGTGLGMTMVYKIIKEFSGEIFVESKENDGTKFTIIFPIPQKDAKLLSKN